MFFIRTANGDMCLNLPDGKTTNGTRINLDICDYSNAQRFTHNPWTKAIVHTPSNKCVQVSGSTAFLQSCSFPLKSNQMWIRKDGGYQSSSAKTCMDSSQGIDEKLVLKSCNKCHVTAGSTS